ncbi:MAG: hypothetical protein ABMB14_19800, partial [Myxococcota bacterium]
LTEDADGYNEFAVDRSYVIVQAAIDDHWNTRVTLDADRLKETELPDGSGVTVDTKYRVFVKHAWLSYKAPKPGLELRAGMIDTPYAPFYDAFVGFRYVTESFPRQWKLLDTADLGVSVLGTQGDGLVDWNVQLVNGEGYAKPEIDAGKMVQARVTVDPLAGGDLHLPITGFVGYSGQPTADQPILTWIGAIGFKQEYITAWAEVDGQSADASGLGFSGTLAPKIPEIVGLFARFDQWDPDTSADGDSGSLLIVGPTHDFWAKGSVALTYEQTMTEAAPDAPGRALVAHVQAGF